MKMTCLNFCLDDRLKRPWLQEYDSNGVKGFLAMDGLQELERSQSIYESVYLAHVVGVQLGIVDRRFG